MTSTIKTIIDGVLRGTGSPAEVLVEHKYSYPHSSEQEAMRSDWRRVGDDLGKSMKRAEGDGKTAS